MSAPVAEGAHTANKPQPGALCSLCSHWIADDSTVNAAAYVRYSDGAVVAVSPVWNGTNFAAIPRCRRDSRMPDQHLWTDEGEMVALGCRVVTLPDGSVQSNSPKEFKARYVAAQE